METFSSFLKTLLFTSLCFIGISGLFYLIFDTPWQLSLTFLVFVLIASLIGLNPRPIWQKNCQNPFLSETNDTNSENPQEKVLTYRGIKYSVNPSSTQPAALTDNPIGQKSLQSLEIATSQLTGQYRGSPLKFPHQPNV